MAAADTLRLGKLWALAAALLLSAKSIVFANPLNPQVVGGTASVQGLGTSAVTVTQTSQRAVINWQNFDIKKGEITQFIQPSRSSVVLNRVTGDVSPTQIFGTLSANGQVFVVNPNGILIGNGAVVNTAGFIATTHDVANGDFMSGRYDFSIAGKPSASVVNLGTITATHAGFAALVAPGVRNAGTITARFGKVALASGQGFSLDLYGDNLIKLAVGETLADQVIDVATGERMSNLIRNEGKVSANGGRVEITAAAARQVVDAVVSNSGVIEARTATMKGGKIVLGGASSSKTKTGTVAIKAPSVKLAAGSKVDVSGPTGGLVTVVADKKVDVEGGSIQANGLADKGGSIAVSAGDEVVLRGAQIAADGQVQGGQILIGNDAAKGSLPFAETTLIDTSSLLSTKAFSLFGQGGFIETSGRLLGMGGTVEAGRGGTWLIDPTNVTISTAAASATNFNVASIQTSINGGSNVTITADGTITLSNALTFANSSGTAATLTLDTSGSGTTTSSVSLNAGIAATGTSAVNLVLRTKGAPISTAASTVVDVSGAITIDNTYGLAAGTATSSAGVTLSGTTLRAAGGDITITGKSAGAAGVTGSSAVSAPNGNLLVSGVGASGINLTGAITAGTANGSARNLTLTGTATSGTGIALSGSMTSTGPVTLTGYAAATGSGITLDGSLTISGTGDLVISAKSAGTAASTYGLSASKAWSIGNGAVTLQGSVLTNGVATAAGADPVTGYTHGLYMFGTAGITATGDIALTGKSTASYGINIDGSGTAIGIASSAGNLSIAGTTAAAVYAVNAPDGRMTSTVGSISATGTLGGIYLNKAWSAATTFTATNTANASSTGFYTGALGTVTSGTSTTISAFGPAAVRLGANVTAGTTLTVTGTSTAGDAINTTSTATLSAPGAITLTGYSAASGSALYLDGAVTVSTAGDVVLSGRNNGTTASTYGIYASKAISTASGKITFQGATLTSAIATAAPGTATYGYTYGIYLTGTAALTATSDISLVGQSNSSYGIYMYANGTPFAITSSTGNITVTGTASATNAIEDGDATITATLGTVTISGTSTSGVGVRFGRAISAGSNVSIIGSGASFGVNANGAVTAGTAVSGGTLTMIGTASSGNGLNVTAALSAKNGIILTGYATASGTGIWLDGTVGVTGVGDLIISAKNAGTSASTYGLYATKAFTVANGKLTIQGATLSGGVATAAPGTNASGYTNGVYLTATAGVTATGDITVGGTGTASYGIYIFNSGTLISYTSSAGNVVMTGTTGTAVYAISADDARVTSTVGSISLTGTLGGIYLNKAWSAATTFTATNTANASSTGFYTGALGTVTSGTSTTISAFGPAAVRLGANVTAGTTLTVTGTSTAGDAINTTSTATLSAPGAITLTGYSAASGSALYLDGAVTVSTAGDVVLSGRNNGTTASTYGIYASKAISTASGKITFQGATLTSAIATAAPGTATYGYTYGIYLTGTAALTATSDISLVGQSNSSYGIYMYANGTPFAITSSTGNITVTGTASATNGIYDGDATLTATLGSITAIGSTTSGTGIFIGRTWRAGTFLSINGKGAAGVNVAAALVTGTATASSGTLEIVATASSGDALNITTAGSISSGAKVTLTAYSSAAGTGIYSDGPIAVTGSGDIVISSRSVALSTYYALYSSKPITTASGEITIQGATLANNFATAAPGAAAQSYSHAIYLTGTGRLAATGNILLQGSANSGYGIYILNSGTAITIVSSAGNITLNGTTASGTYGVSADDAQVTATLGAISSNGTGGIYLNKAWNAGTSIMMSASSTTGWAIYTGTTGTISSGTSVSLTGASVAGVYVSALVSAGSTLTINAVGTNGNGLQTAAAGTLRSVNTMRLTTYSVASGTSAYLDGLVQVTGAGDLVISARNAGLSASTYGVYASKAMSIANGNATIQGSTYILNVLAAAPGTAAYGYTWGVYFLGTSGLTATGAININASANASYGIYLANGGTIPVSSSSGDITINATTGGATWAAYLANGVLTANSGRIIVTGSAAYGVYWNGAWSAQTMTITGYATAGHGLQSGVGGTLSATGNINLIGYAVATGHGMYIDGAITITGAYDIIMSGYHAGATSGVYGVWVGDALITGGKVIIQGSTLVNGVPVANPGSFARAQDTGVWLAAGANIDANGDIWIAGKSVAQAGVRLNAGGTVINARSRNGNITINGESSGGDWGVETTYGTITADAGNISVRGSGGHGVYIGQSITALNNIVTPTAGGTISITGIANLSNAGYYGVQIVNAIRAWGSVIIYGQNAPVDTANWWTLGATSAADGVYLNGAVRSWNSSVTITGYSSATQGISVSAAGTITAASTVSLTGKSYGTSILSSAGITAGGDIILDGVTGVTGGGWSLNLTGGFTIQSTSGNVSISGQGAYGVYLNQIVVAGNSTSTPTAGGSVTISGVAKRYDGGYYGLQIVQPIRAWGAINIYGEVAPVATANWWTLADTLVGDGVYINAAIRSFGSSLTITGYSSGAQGIQTLANGTLQAADFVTLIGKGSETGILVAAAITAVNDIMIDAELASTRAAWGLNYGGGPGVVTQSSAGNIIMSGRGGQGANINQTIVAGNNVTTPTAGGAVSISGIGGRSDAGYYGLRVIAPVSAWGSINIYGQNAPVTTSSWWALAATSAQDGVYVNAAIRSFNSLLTITGYSSGSYGINLLAAASLQSAGDLSLRGIGSTRAIYSATNIISGGDLLIDGLTGVGSDWAVYLSGTTVSATSGVISLKASGYYGLYLSSAVTAGNSTSVIVGAAATFGGNGILIDATARSLEAVRLAGASITNNTRGGELVINLSGGGYYDNSATMLTGGVNSGRISINGNGVGAGITATAGSTITQNSNGGIWLGTTHEDLTPHKITNNGTGMVVVAAGTSYNAGTATGGQIVALSTTNVITSGNGNVYLFSGTPTSTPYLNVLSSKLATLTWDNVAFGEAFGEGSTRVTVLPPSGINLDSSGGRSATTASTYGPFVQFRATPTANLLLSSAVNWSKVYGADDPDLTGSSSVVGSLQNKINTNLVKAAGNTSWDVATSSLVLTGGTGYAIKLDWARTLPTIVATSRTSLGTLAGEQVSATPYAYNVTSTRGLVFKAATGTTSPGTTATIGLTITARPVTITPENDAKIYGDTLTLGQYATASTFDGAANTGLVGYRVVNGVVLKDTLGAFTITSSGAAATANAGSYSITVSAAAVTGVSGAAGSSTANYSFTYGTGTLVVRAADLVITPLNNTANYTGSAALTNSTYSVAVTNYTFTGFKNSQTSANITLTGLLTFNGTTPTTLTTSGAYVIGQGTLALSGTNAANYNLIFTPGSVFRIFDAVVAPTTTIVLRATAVSMAYGSAAPTVTGIAVLNGATLNATQLATYTTGTLTWTTSAGVGSNVGQYAITASGLTAKPGYSIQIDGGNNSVLSVTPRVLSLAATRAYDGTTSIAASDITLGSLVSGQTLTLSGTSNARYADAGLSGNVLTSVSGLSIADGTGAASNYTLKGATSTVTITPLTLIISGSRVYDATTSVGASALSLSGMVAGESATLTAGTATLASANVGTYTGGAFSGGAFSVSGATARAANYALPSTYSSISVTPAKVTIAGSRAYDGTATFVASDLTVTGVNNQTLSVSGGSLTADSIHAGIATSFTSISGLTLADGTGANAGLASNYTIVGANSSATITPRLVTVTINNAAGSADKVYDGTTNLLDGFVPTYAVTGALSGDTMRINAASVGYDSARVASVTGIVARGLSISSFTSTGSSWISDYDVGNANSQAVFAATITPKALTLGVLGTVTKVYDGTTSIPAGTSLSQIRVVSGFVNGDFAASISGTSAAFNSPNVTAANSVIISGLSIASVSGSRASLPSDYSVPSTWGAYVGTITPKPIVVTGSKGYDGTNLFTLAQLSIASGAVAGETLALTGGRGTSTSAATGTYNQGSFGQLTISVSGGNALASNYKMPASGTLLINKSNIIINLGGTKVYDGTATFTASLLSASATDGQSLNLSGSALANSADVLTASYLSDVSGLTLSGGNASANYTLVGGTKVISITAKALSITGSTVTAKAYDGGTSATIVAGTLSGLIGTQTLAVTGAGTFADANAGTGKNVTVIYTLSNGTNGGLASNYSLAGQTLTGTINPKTLVVNGSSVASKAYDGTTTASVTAGSLLGLVGTQTLSVTAAGTFADANAGTGKSVAVTYTLADGTYGGLAANYTVATQNLTGTITRKALTISGSTVTTKTYDANSAASLVAGTLSGLIGSETLVVTGTGTFADANAGAGKSVTVTYTLANGTNGGLAANYSLAGQSLTGTISPKALSISGSSVTAKTYDATTAAGIVAGTLSGLVGSETLIVTGTGTFADANAGSGKSVSVTYMLADNAGLASNYSLAGQTLTSAISAKALTIAGSTVTAKDYDASTSAAIVAGTLSGLVGSQTLNVTGAGTFVDANAGAGKNVSVTYTLANGTNGGFAANYTLGSETLTGKINQKALTISSASATNKTYDGTTTASVTAGTLSGLVGTQTLTVSATGAFDSASVGTGKTVTVSYTLGNGTNGGLATNYSLATTNATANITAKALTLNGATGVTKTYDGSDALPVGESGYQTLTGLVSGDNVSLAGTPIFASANAGTRAIVQGTLVLTGSSASNYALTWVNGSGTINRATLTMTANDAAKVLTDTDPTFSARYSGFVNGETASVLSGVSITRAAGESAGSYTLTPTATAANYVIAPVTGTFTIHPADQLLITIADSVSTYGVAPTRIATSAKYYSSSAVALKTLTLNNLGYDNWEAVENGTQAATFRLTMNGLSTSISGQINVGTYSIGATNVQQISNNFTTLNFRDGVLTVNAKTVSISQSGVSKTYDGSVSMAGLSLSTPDIFFGDYANLNGTGTFASANVGSNLTYNVAGLRLSGADAGNYALATSSLSGTNGQITAKALTISGSSIVTRAYDGATSASVTAGTLNGLVGSQTLVVTGAATYSDANAGSGKTASVTYTLANGTNGGLAMNYTLADETLTGTISQKSLTITGSSVTAKDYDRTTSATITAGTLSGMVGVQTLSATASGSFTTSSAGTGKVVTVTYTLADGTGLASNYVLAGQTLTGTINPLTITYAFIAANKTYDGTAAATVSGSLSGVLGSDVVTVAASSATFANKNAGNGKSVTISGVTLSGGDAGNYQIASTTTTATANIIAKNITSSWTAADKTYDATRTASVTGSLSGVLAGDTVTVSSSGALFADANAGTGKTVTISGLSLGGTSAGNYALTSTSATTTANIEQKALTATFTGTNKIYDGGLLASVSASSADIVGSDAVTIIWTGSTFADKNTGTSKIISVAGISLSGAASGNYALQSTSGTAVADITAAPVTVSFTASNRIYDGTVNAGVTQSATGLVAGDAVTVSWSSAAFANKNVGTAKTVTISGISLGGTDAANYALQNTSATASANIAAKTVTVTYTAADKVYDGSSSASVTANVQGLVNGDSVSLSNGAATFADKNAGILKVVSVPSIALSGTDANNYVLSATSATTTATISAKALTASFTASNKTYDGTDIASVSGASSDIVAGDNVTISVASAAFADKDVGGNKSVAISGIAISGTDAGNYLLQNTSATVSADINRRALTMTANDAAKILTENDPVLTARYSGFVNGETASVLSGVSLTRAAGETAGTYTITPAASATNYTITLVNGTFTVEGAGKLLVSIADTTTTYGTNSAFAPVSARYYSASDQAILTLSLANTIGNSWVARETLNGVTSDAATFTLGALSGTNSTAGALVVGDYQIGATASARLSGNFTTLTFNNGTLSVTPKTLTTAMANVSKTYDGTTTAASVSLSLTGVLTNDLVSVSSTGAAFAARNVGTGIVVTANGLTLSGADKGNYVLAAQTATGSGEILAKSVTASFSATSKTYNGTTAASVSGWSNGVVAGDVIIFDASTADFANKNVGTGKTVTISGISLGGADAGNYALVNQTATASANITAKTITVSYTAADKVYDGATTANVNGTSSSLVSGDQVTIVQTSADFADKNVGTAKQVSIAGIVLTGTDAGNYFLAATTATAQASITPKALTLTFAAANKTYDATTAATVTGSSSGILAGDSVTITQSAAVFADKNVGISKTVTITGVSLSGADAANYSLGSTSATAQANITAKSLTATFTGSDKTYDGTTSANVSGTSADVLAGDNVVVLFSAANFANKNVGTGKSVNITGVSLSGTDAGNYALASTSGSASASITAKTVAASYAASDKVYDGTAQATVTGSLIGLIANDNVSVAQLSANFADRNVGILKSVSVSGLSLTGTDSGNYVLSASSVTTTASITAKPLTASFTGIDKVFDGTTNANVTGSSADLVGSDVVAINATGAVFADKNVGTGKSIAVTGIYLSGTDAGNYILQNTTASTAADITRKSLTLTANDNAKVYSQADPTLSARASGFVGTDDMSVLTGLIVTRVSGETPGTYRISASANAANYTINAVDATFTIEAADRLLVTIGSSSTTYGSSVSFSPSSAIYYSSAQSALVQLALVNTGGNNWAARENGVTAASFTLGTATSSYSTGGYLSVGSYMVTATASNQVSNNFNALVFSSGIAQITAKSVTATVNSYTRIYDATTVATGATLALSGVMTNDLVSATTTGIAFANKAANSTVALTAGGLALSGADAANYVLSNIDATGRAVATGTGAIQAKAIVVSANAANKVYDGSAAASVTLYSNDVISGDMVSFVYTSADFATKSVGTGVVVTASGIGLSGADGGNYVLQNASAMSSANITAKPITTSFTASDKVYDGTVAAAASGTSSAFVVGDSVSVTYTGAVFADRNVGAGKSVAISGVALSGVDAGNYSLLATSATASASITAKLLTVTVTASNKTYDGTRTASAIGASSDIFGSDVVTINFAAADFADRNASVNKSVTVSGISLSGTDAGNYALQNTTATTQANISPLTVTPSFTVASRAYDGTIAANVSGTASAFIAGDQVSITQAQALFADKNIGVAKTVNISSVSLTGAAASNYQLSSMSAQAQGTITAKILTPAFLATSKLFDGTTTAKIADVTSGIAAGDNVFILYTSATFVDASGGQNKPVVITGLSLGGAGALNYLLSGFSAFAYADIRMPAVPFFALNDRVHLVLHAETAIETTNRTLVFDQRKSSQLPIIRCSEQRSSESACGY